MHSFAIQSRRCWRYIAFLAEPAATREMPQVKLKLIPPETRTTHCGGKMMSQRICRLLLTALLMVLSSWGGTGVGRGEEIGFVEDFALAKDRAAALQQLIPGSEDYYYYACLHFQNLQQYDQVEQLLAAWIKRYGETPRVLELQNRQALLTYATQPQASLDFLRRRLDLQFDHQREAVGEKPNLPTQFDPQLLSRDRLAQLALQKHGNLDGFTDAALDWLVAWPLDPDRRRALLQRLNLPDRDNLARLVVDDLNHRFSGPFGQLPLHRQLLLEDLVECLQLKPELRDQAAFVSIYLSKLHPSDDTNWRQDPEQYEAYLERMWEYVQTLSPVHNSLKAHLLYHWLVLDRARGHYDRDRFMEYIQLPRKASYIEPRFLQEEQNVRHPADLSSDFQVVTLLPPVGNDEELIRSYLHHFFLTENDTKPFAPFIRDDFLRENLAETKIVNGLGEPEQWYSLLPPEKYQALKDRIDIDFAHTNPTQFAIDQPVELDVFIKNVSTLIVKVFEINTQNYYQQHQREVNTDIDLDGLVANEERSLEWDGPPLRRVRRRFSFEQLRNPGIYVIDFIGSGKSSRVVIRKGALRYLVRDTAAGHLFTIYDDQQRPVRDAKIGLGGREFSPDAEGRIVVPYTHTPQRETIIISRGHFSVFDRFDHHGEEYRLEAAVYVDRESLLQNQSAELAIRTALYLNGTPVSPRLLKQPRLTLISTDLDGISSSRELKDLSFTPDQETIVPLKVPPRLSQLRIRLEAKVEQGLKNQSIDLSDEKTFQLNAIDTTDQVDDFHLGQMGPNYYVEMLGKTGEPRADQPIQVSLQHRDFRDPIEVSLQTDPTGRILLGPLPDVEWVRVSTLSGNSREWSLRKDEFSYPETWQAVAGQPLSLPITVTAERAERNDWALLEMRGATFVADRFQALSITARQLQIAPLPPGDYLLVMKATGRRLRLQVTAGAVRDGYVLGTRRYLQTRKLPPMQLTAVEQVEDQLRIRLANTNSLTRVHLIASHYVPVYSAYQELARVASPEPYQIHWSPPLSLYLEGRSIGDEYQYILDRRLASRYPGVMLERPSLLLKPWEVQGTQTGRQEAAAGEAPSAKRQAPSSAVAQGEGEALRADSRSDFSNLDFLARPALTRWNLKPDATGLITLPRAPFASYAALQVIAVDPENTLTRAISLEPQATQTQDLRLANSLDPQQHFTQRQQFRVVTADTPLVLADISTSRFELYDSLRRVYELYATLSNDSTWNEFSFVARWPQLTPEQQRELYGRYACHELNFFLFRKDPEFFRTVVRPFLANKLHPTFLDHWLLEADLTPYLQPWRYARLNVVERILLAQRIPADQSFLQQDLKDRLSLLPPDPQRREILFETALKGKALETSELELLRAAALAESPDALLAADRLAPGGMGWMGLGGTGAMQDSRPARRNAAQALPAAAPPAPAAPAPMLADAAPAEMPDMKFEARFENGVGGARAAREKEALEYFGDDKLARKAAAFFQPLDTTREWAENNYYQLALVDQNADRVSVSAFWRDYANHNPAQPFLSAEFADASHNFTEMMFALAVLDLPFDSPEHAFEQMAGRLQLRPAQPLIAVYEELQPTTAAAGTPILVSLNFFRHGDRYRFEENERLDKFVTDEFLTGTAYGCQIVVTNPTSAPQKLELLLQIPAGSLPILGTKPTRTARLALPPYGTQTIEYSFYFPMAGKFPHYPVQVARNAQFLTSPPAVQLQVVEQLSRVDRSSWDYVSQQGSDQDVLDFLTRENLHLIDLTRIAFRLRDKAFFLRVIDLLAKRHVYHQVIWSYSLYHDLPAWIRQYLQHADAFIALCGASIESPLLTIDPVTRQTYQQLDYRPFVNARAHQLGRRRQILNDRLHAQYHGLLKTLTYRRELNDEQKMIVIYYLLLQDRFTEALDLFAEIRPENLITKMQYDYCAAYLKLIQSDPTGAKEIVARYADHPEPRWRDTFRQAAQQLAEIEGATPVIIDPENREQAQGQLAAAAPAFEFQVDAKQIRLRYRNLPGVQVSYYLMDIELLFSRNPFVGQDAKRFSQIRPNLTQYVELPADQNELAFSLPDSLLNANVLVEISGQGRSLSQAYFANSLGLQVAEAYGQLQVVAAEAGKPLPKAYVKVYARTNDGLIRFYKDGYTDLRGRFDYASLSTNELDRVERFSVLVMTDDRGALVREVGPPKR